MSRPERRPAARAAAAVLAALLTLLGGCASGPDRDRDGPDERPPAGLERTPDAVPRLEPLRSGGPNKPYAIGGRSYVPLAAEAPLRETGLASWYGRKYHGRPTASGEPYDMYAMSAAHPTLPLPSYARVRNPANGREVVVRVNDRGPFVPGRVIDLSYTAALKLGLLAGVAPVEVNRITPDEIRSGRWARGAGPADDPPPASPAAAPLAAADGPGFWLQLGAYRARDGATALQQQLLRDAVAPALAPAVEVREEDGVFRVQAGPWPTRELALRAQAQLRERLGLAALLRERR